MFQNQSGICHQVQGSPALETPLKIPFYSSSQFSSLLRILLEGWEIRKDLGGKEKRALDPQDQMTDEAATENTEDLDLDEATAELGLDGAKGSIGDGLVYRQ